MLGGLLLLEEILRYITFILRISNFTVGKIDKCTIAPSLLLCNREAMLSLVKELINVLQPHLKILDLQPDHLNRGLEVFDLTRPS